MKTIERIFKHLNEEKVELKAERVELSVANDIKNGIKAGNSQLKKLASAENFLKKAQNTFEDALDKTRSVISESNFYNNQVDVVNKAKKIAKELGVDPRSISGLSQLLNLMDQVEQSERDLEKIISQKIT